MAIILNTAPRHGHVLEDVPGPSLIETIKKFTSKKINTNGGGFAVASARVAAIFDGALAAREINRDDREREKEYISGWKLGMNQE